MNQSQHDELAALFAQRMNFAPVDPMQHQQNHAFVENVSTPQFSEKQEQSPIHYASAHYTHSHHLQQNAVSEPYNSPPPPYREAIIPDNMLQTLRDHSIDPSALLPNQLHLFATSDLDQRLRLLELWRISPPSYSLEQHLHATQIPTSLAEEEASARQRYEAQVQSQAPRNLVFDTHIEPPRISPIRQDGEPAWPPAARMRAASIASSKPTAHYAGEAEPYITDGYGSNPSASSIEPVYAATSGGLWPGGSGVQQPSIEDQYGAFMQVRNHADWEAMNERIARERFGMVVHAGRSGEDDDMVM